MVEMVELETLELLVILLFSAVAYILGYIT